MRRARTEYRTGHAAEVHARGARPIPLLASCVAALLVGLPALAQTAPAEPEPEGASAAPTGNLESLAAIDVQPPLPRDAMSAFAAVEGWVRALEVPAEPVSIPATRGACIVLRLDNRIIGRGVGITDDETGVWTAARAAIAEAIERIPVVNDATIASQRRAAAARITISLELGGRLIPMRADAWTQIDAQVNVAMDAVVARLSINEEERVGATFPSVMRLRGDAPSVGVARAIAEASGDPLLALPSDARSTPRSLREQHGVRLFRCRVTHLAQSDPAAAPTFLYRGSRLVQGADVSRVTIETWSIDMARHLSRRFDVLSYEPATEPGLFAPRAPLAPELALTIRALERRLARPGVPESLRSEASSAIEAMRARLRDGFPKDKAVSAMSAAAMALAGVESDPAIAARVEDALASAVTSDGQWRADISLASRGFIAWALAERALEASIAAPVAVSDQAAPDPAAPDPAAPDPAATHPAITHPAITRADRALRSIYRETRESDLVAQMPWLFFAEESVARGRDTIPASASLRNVRDMIIRHQLTDADAGEEGLDLIGGIVYTRNGAALPTAQSARAIAFLCAAVADPRVTSSSESLTQLSPALSGVRFLRQLTMDPASAHIAIAPTTAIGGVQAAAWDTSQPIEATAISLIAACEILDALDELGKGPAEAPSPSPNAGPAPLRP